MLLAVQLPSFFSGPVSSPSASWKYFFVFFLMQISWSYLLADLLHLPSIYWTISNSQFQQYPDWPPPPVRYFLVSWSQGWGIWNPGTAHLTIFWNNARGIWHLCGIGFTWAEEAHKNDVVPISISSWSAFDQIWINNINNNWNFWLACDQAVCTLKHWGSWGNKTHCSS